MAPDDISTRVLTLLQAEAGADRTLSPGSVITVDAGLDSVSIMDVVLELEDEFDITIPLDSLADVRTVSDLAEVVARLRGEAAGQRPAETAPVH